MQAYITDGLWYMSLTHEICVCLSILIYLSTQGNASGGERARFAGKAGNVMVDCAWDYINRGNVLREQPAAGIYIS